MTFVDPARLCNAKASVSGMSVTTGAARVVRRTFLVGSEGSTTNVWPFESTLTVSSFTAVDQAAFDIPDDRCQPISTEPDCDDTYSPREGWRGPAYVGAELETTEAAPITSADPAERTTDRNGRIIKIVLFD